MLFTKRPIARLIRELGKLKTGKTQRLVVKCQGAGTARLCAESSDDGIGERALSILKRDHGRENLLLVLHNEHFSLKHALDGRSDFMSCETIGTVQNPHGPDHRHNAEEAGVFLGQSPFDYLCCLQRLNWVILR